MKLRKLKIENFRGITNLELDFGDVTVIIGENNTGKTAVLDALRFLLRDVRFRRGCAFESYDFHLPSATSEPADAPAIVIQGTFSEDNPGEWGAKQLGILNRAKIAQVDPRGCAAVILKVSARFDVAIQDFIQNWEFCNLGGASLGNMPDTALGTLQNEVSYYYLAALRDAAKHFDAKGPFWRPFLKESQLPSEKRIEIEQKLAEINDLIVSSHGTFSKVVERLKEVKDIVSMSASSDLVSIDAIPRRLFDMLVKTQVNLNTGTGAKIPLGRHGDGIQSLAVLTLFNAFLQTWNRGDPIVALEEPEAHLHPSAIRALWPLIEKMPGQKIISTHSGDLISEVPSNAVVRLYRHNGNTISKNAASISLAPDKKKQFDFHIRQTRGELLFARCWLLCEGQTEVTLLPEIARYQDKNFERNGIRCVAYRQSDISVFVEVAEKLGIHWIALTDNDQQGLKDQIKVRASLGTRQESDVLFIMPESNVEQHLCASGFASIYEGFLTQQTKKKITVPSGDQKYFEQLTDAVDGYKIAGVHLVLDAIKSGVQVPSLLERAIDKTIQLANSV